VFLSLIVFVGGVGVDGVLRNCGETEPGLLQILRTDRRRAADGGNILQSHRQDRHEQFPARVNDFETSFLILFVLGLCVRQFVARKQYHGHCHHRDHAGRLDVCSVAVEFHSKDQFFQNVDGHFYLLYFVVITKFSDTGAYAVGSLIGRHKMIPRISPGKTWEGIFRSDLRFPQVPACFLSTLRRTKCRR